MIRSVIALLAIVMVVVYGGVSSYPKQFQLNLSDVIVVNKTDGGVCFTAISKLNTTSPENCGCCITGGCPHCGYVCLNMFGMPWICCEGMWCCCYPSYTGSCAQPGMHCNYNYC